MGGCAYPLSSLSPPSPQLSLSNSMEEAQTDLSSLSHAMEVELVSHREAMEELRGGARRGGHGGAVGAGPAGLSVAACLRTHGVPSVVLDRARLRGLVVAYAVRAGVEPRFN